MQLQGSKQNTKATGQKGNSKSKKKLVNNAAYTQHSYHLLLLLVLFSEQKKPCIFTSSATKIEACWRGAQARKERERRAWAVKVIKK